MEDPACFEPFGGDDDTWQLAVTKKPIAKKVVLHLGNISPDTIEESLTKFITERAKNLVMRWYSKRRAKQEGVCLPESLFQLRH